MEFGGGRSHRMAAWTHIRERENEGRTEDGGVVYIHVLHMLEVSTERRYLRHGGVHRVLAPYLKLFRAIAFTKDTDRNRVGM